MWFVCKFCCLSYIAFVFLSISLKKYNMENNYNVGKDFKPPLIFGHLQQRKSFDLNRCEYVLSDAFQRQSEVASNFLLSIPVTTAVTKCIGICPSLGQHSCQGEERRSVINTRHSPIKFLHSLRIWREILVKTELNLNLPFEDSWNPRNWWMLIRKLAI